MDVIVSIYARKYFYDRSYVKLHPTRLNVVLKFPETEKSSFSIDQELFGVSQFKLRMSRIYIKIIFML